MFLIKRLWIDTMENRDAYGFEDIGVVARKEEADRICSLEEVPKSKYPWPLNYAFEFKGDSVPRFIAKRINDIDGMALEQLKSIKNCTHCRVELQPGVAMYPTYKGTGDFCDNDIPVTLSQGGQGKLDACLKCPECGYSIAI